MNKSFKSLRIVILILTAFLLCYHFFKLYTIYFGNDLVSSTDFLNSYKSSISFSTILTIQSVLRSIIITSLLLIILRKNIGIPLMCIGIGVLIISQFFVVSRSTNEMINSIHSGLKPLKGLILPIIITYLYKLTS